MITALIRAPDLWPTAECVSNMLFDNKDSIVFIVLSYKFSLYAAVNRYKSNHRIAGPNFRENPVSPPE